MDERLVDIKESKVIMGPGGCGKTTEALRSIVEAVSRDPDNPKTVTILAEGPVRVWILDHCIRVVDEPSKQHFGNRWHVKRYPSEYMMISKKTHGVIEIISPQKNVRGHRPDLVYYPVFGTGSRENLEMLRAMRIPIWIERRVDGLPKMVVFSNDVVHCTHTLFVAADQLAKQLDG